jgi:hypothetical protein
MMRGIAVGAYLSTGCVVPAFPNLQFFTTDNATEFFITFMHNQYTPQIPPLRMRLILKVTVSSKYPPKKNAALKGAALFFHPESFYFGVVAFASFE